MTKMWIWHCYREGELNPETQSTTLLDFSFCFDMMGKLASDSGSQILSSDQLYHSYLGKILDSQSWVRSWELYLSISPQLGDSDAQSWANPLKTLQFLLKLTINLAFPRWKGRVSDVLHRWCLLPDNTSEIMHKPQIIPSAFPGNLCFLFLKVDNCSPLLTLLWVRFAFTSPFP